MNLHEHELRHEEAILVDGNRYWGAGNTWNEAVSKAGKAIEAMFDEWFAESSR